MRVSVHFYSYFKDLAGCDQAEQELPASHTLADLLRQVFERLKPCTKISIAPNYAGVNRPI